MWPHHVDSPICVYDRESFDKYKSGEFKHPTHCICGVELSYEEPVCICLVERGQMNGEMLVEVPILLTHVQLNLGTDVGKTEDELATYEVPERTQKKLRAEADLKDQALKRALDEADDEEVQQVSLPTPREDDPMSQALKKALDEAEVKDPEAWERAGESFAEQFSPKKQSIFGEIRTGEEEPGPLTREDVEEHGRMVMEQSSMGSRVEAPWWAGKDVVGMLRRRGWEFAPDGMFKRGPGMLSDLHIPSEDIIGCHDVPEEGADRLESEARDRSRP
jgi:hypothetical protein